MQTPPQFTVEAIAQAFMELIRDRYPSPDKVLKLARQLGAEGDVEMQIIIFSGLRDMVRRVSRDYLYRSIQHRDDVYNAIITALEDLENKLEEMEDQGLRDELERAKRTDNQPTPAAARNQTTTTAPKGA